ncbi:MAG: DUF3482 domain-containing protein [Nostoc sp. GBBB01]|nr:DUF3482 domain-containing protein [Nostoc sp. GBBB01]
MNHNLVEIGFAGRTNSGKTTAIRTLMRKAVGVVGDRPNVTQVAEKFPSSLENPSANKHIGIQAIFVDCPGFQMASLSRHFIDKLEELLKLDAKAKYDARAIEALKEVDIVIYVATLEDVPNDDYVNEIELIKSLKKPCIVILNKFRKRSDKGSERSTMERAKLWKVRVREVCDFPVMDFDAHWQNPSSTKELYQHIKECLPKDCSVVFEEGLKNFYKHQDQIRKDISTAFVNLIKNCREKVNVIEITGKDTVEKKLKEQAYRATQEFFLKISEIYKLSASPNANDRFSFNHSSNTNFWDMVTNGAAGAGGGAAIGSAVGAVVGAVVGFFGGAGIGVGPGALAGAQIGGAILGTLGGSGGFIVGIDNRHQGQISEQYLAVIFDRAIGLSYAMASHGFGLGSNLRDEDITAMMERAKELRIKNYSNIKLLSASDEEISNLAQNLLRVMET